MIGNDNSLTGGIIGAVTILGVVSLRDIRYTFLEEDGHVSVVIRPPARPRVSPRVREGS